MVTMSSLFRRRNDEGLPTTMNKNGSSVFSLKSNPNDGSARNIRLEQSLSKKWSHMSVATRATYGSLTFFLLLLYFGIRWIRFSNAYIHLNCRLATCDLQIMPLGWGRKIRLEFPRRQLLEGVAVKTLADGSYVPGAANVNDDYITKPAINKKGKKYIPAHKQSTKGPDAHGHYVSYALLLTDQEPDEPQIDGEEGDQPVPIKDLSALSDYLERLPQEQGGDADPENALQLRKYRLVLRKFRIGQSKRRVRTILAKIEAYIKRRRTQLVVKETSPPAWQGILGIVVGLMGTLLTLLLGQLWDDVPLASGPGVRRESKTSKGNLKSGDTMRRTTPAKYEVATSHQAPRLTTAAKRNTVSQRDRVKQPWMQANK